MSPLLTLHLLAIGIWLGVVGAEFVIEFDGMKSREARLRAAQLHYLTDIWIEVPAFTIVLLTGVLMLTPEHLSGLFLIKIIFGLAAILFNLVCVIAVMRRKKYAVLNQIEAMDKNETLMKIGGLVIPTFLIALGISIYLIFI